ncbi:hypothetical protein B9G53_07105 [Pseudanabaena sp. SR411]|uniref:low-complexity tail membrane protein n=1 Tax=Pseudanabaena sp. SR411 TaxID=1980935 RepID=UPI000B997ECD|nr:low-complexity tail membrane protein [Pseudanabaena sp. SR411]OYQ65517.1 hypothetical protein B9G53_07105 [Pseudanabaena sp. SR411]
MTSSPSPNPTSNISLGNHPFIWGNIALLAGVPWLLALSMAGLAVGDPVFPAWFEIFLLGFPAITLAAWVQWQQPISPFSLWFVSKPSESLSEPERQILTLVKQHRNGWYVTGWIAAIVAITMSAIFCKLYLTAPLAQVIAPFPASLRLFGIIWAEIFFLLSNILAQAGISALRIKLTAESDIHSLQPFAVDKIKNNFTNIGWRSPQLLKFFEEDAIVEVSNNLPQGKIASEVADEASDQSPDVKESPEQETEETAPSNVEITSALEPTELSSESQIETIIDEEIVQESEVADVSPEDQLVEEVDELEISEIIAEESVIEAIAETETEQVEVEAFLDVPDVIAETQTEESTISENETVLEFADISSDVQLVEEVDELEISAIVSEEFVIESIAEPEIEQIFEEPQIESVLNQELDPEIVQEPEQVDPIEIFEESEVETPPDTLDAIAKTEIDESSTSENEPVLEFADINIDDQLVEEVDELEFSAIVAEESIFEAIAEPEVEQLFEEPQIESGLNQELDQAITQEPEELNPFASDDSIDEALPVETELEISDTASESTIEDPEIENIVEETDELVAFETDEDPDLTFLEIPDSSSEATLEETEQADASLDPTDTFLDEQLAEDKEELESIETVEDSDVEVVDNTATANDDKRGIDFFKKLRKTGVSPKKLGFGKSIKRNDLPVSIPEVFEPEPEIINELDQWTNIEAIADPIEPELESFDSETQDFDDELDELIAFNAYVENILKEYLEDNDEESEDVDNNLETVQIIEATPELDIESNVEQSLVDEESLDEESSELIDPSIVFDPTQEAIAQENVESFTENLPALDTQVSEESSEEIASNDQKIQDAKYLVQEFLVDKFFARLEQLNNVDKVNQEKEQPQEIPSEIDTEIDEFADLEALLDGTPLNEDNNTEDLSDRNS